VTRILDAIPAFLAGAILGLITGAMLSAPLVTVR
jgi:hypothetical protein